MRYRQAFNGCLPLQLLLATGNLQGISSFVDPSAMGQGVQHFMRAANVTFTYTLPDAACQPAASTLVLSICAPLQGFTDDVPDSVQSLHEDTRSEWRCMLATAQQPFDFKATCTQVASAGIKPSLHTAAYKTQKSLRNTEVAQGSSGQPQKLAHASNFASILLGINTTCATQSKRPKLLACSRLFSSNIVLIIMRG